MKLNKTLSSILHQNISFVCAHAGCQQQVQSGFLHSTFWGLYDQTLLNVMGGFARSWLQGHTFSSQLCMRTMTPPPPPPVMQPTGLNPPSDDVKWEWEEKLGSDYAFKRPNWRTWQHVLINAGSSTGHAPSDLRGELGTVWITGSLGVFFMRRLCRPLIFDFPFFLFDHAALNRDAHFPPRPSQTVWMFSSPRRMNDKESLRGRGASPRWDKDLP